MNKIILFEALFVLAGGAMNALSFLRQSMGFSALTPVEPSMGLAVMAAVGVIVWLQWKVIPKPAAVVATLLGAFFTYVAFQHLTALVTGGWTAQNATVAGAFRGGYAGPWSAFFAGAINVFGAFAFLSGGLKTLLAGSASPRK